MAYNTPPWYDSERPQVDTFSDTIFSPEGACEGSGKGVLSAAAYHCGGGFPRRKSHWSTALAGGDQAQSSVACHPHRERKMVRPVSSDDYPFPDSDPLCRLAERVFLCAGSVRSASPGNVSQSSRASGRSLSLLIETFSSWTSSATIRCRMGRRHDHAPPRWGHDGDQLN